MIIAYFKIDICHCNVHYNDHYIPAKYTYLKFYDLLMLCYIIDLMKFCWEFKSVTNNLYNWFVKYLVIYHIDLVNFLIFTIDQCEKLVSAMYRQCPD